MGRRWGKGVATKPNGVKRREQPTVLFFRSLPGRFQPETAHYMKDRYNNKQKGKYD
jgi:hypothetical protein